MPIKTEIVSTQHDSTQLKGHAFSKQESDALQPAIMVCHAWGGCDAFARSAAEKMADWGYVGFAADLYGEGRVGTSTEENAGLMQPLVENRELLRERLLAILTQCVNCPGLIPIGLR